MQLNYKKIFYNVASYVQNVYTIKAVVLNAILFLLTKFILKFSLV